VCTRLRVDSIYLPKHGFNSSEYRDGRCFCTMRAPRCMRIRREERTDAVEESLEKYTRPWVTVINHPRSYSGDLFRFLLARRRSTEYPPRNGRAGRKADGRVEGVKSSIGTTSLTIRCSSSHATKHYKIQVTLR